MNETKTPWAKPELKKLEERLEDVENFLGTGSDGGGMFSSAS